PRLHSYQKQAYQNEVCTLGERVQDWLMQARRLKRLYQIWDLLEADNKNELGHIIRWDTNGVIALFPEVNPLGEHTGTAIAHGIRNIDWLKRWKPGDVIGPAKLYLVDQFNENMHQMASPMLLLDAKGALRPYNSPASLLAALWLEFGQVASG